jgi:hypothetical protein
MGLWALALLWVVGIATPASVAAAPVQKPAAQKPAAQKPGAQKPSAQKPGAQTPAAKEPTAKEPAAPKAVGPVGSEDATKGGAGEPKAAEPGKAQAPAGVKPKPKKSGPDPFAGGGTPDVRQSDIYGDRLDGLQSDVEVLKDKIFRSKARLSLLKETVLRGVLAGSRVILAHRNLMGASFRLFRIVYSMDGAQIYARTDETGGLDSEDEIVIYDGNLPPGPHNVTIELEYRGHGYGIFTYLNQYTYTSKQSHSFTAPENGAIKLTSVGYKDGNITTEKRDQPNVQFQELPLDASGRPLPKTRKRKRK